MHSAEPEFPGCSGLRRPARWATSLFGLALLSVKLRLLGVKSVLCGVQVGYSEIDVAFPRSGCTRSPPPRSSRSPLKIGLLLDGCAVGDVVGDSCLRKAGAVRRHLLLVSGDGGFRGVDVGVDLLRACRPAASYCWLNADILFWADVSCGFDGRGLGFGARRWSHLRRGAWTRSTVPGSTVTMVITGKSARRSTRALRADRGVEWRRGRSTSVTMGDILLPRLTSFKHV